VIIDKLGTPSEDDMSFISDPGARSYLQNFPKCEKKNFKDMYPFPGDEAIDLLDKMLQFNPYKRASLNECLNHPLLADVRDPKKEIQANTPIVLDFEYEDVNSEILRELFVEEILFFRKFYKRQPRGIIETL
jgi:serine/threonine protein kinase